MALVFLVGQTVIAQAASTGPYGDKHIRRDDYVNYLGTRCRTLHDQLNRPAAQNYNPRTTEAEMLRLREMRRQYDEYCQEELGEAMSKSNKARQAQRQERLNEQKLSKTQLDNQQLEEARKRQMCVESRRILMIKKQRNDLNVGELQELVRFEENFRTRCASTSTAGSNNH